MSTMNDGTILLPTHPPKLTKLELQLIYFFVHNSHPFLIPTFPPNSLILLSSSHTFQFFAAGPIVELGQKDQILSADKVNLNYCQDLIQLVKYEYSFELLILQTTKQGNIIIVKRMYSIHCIHCIQGKGLF